MSATKLGNIIFTLFAVLASAQPGGWQLKPIWRRMEIIDRSDSVAKLNDGGGINDGDALAPQCQICFLLWLRRLHLPLFWLRQDDEYDTLGWNLCRNIFLQNHPCIHGKDIHNTQRISVMILIDLLHHIIPSGIPLVLIYCWLKQMGLADQRV